MYSKTAIECKSVGKEVKMRNVWANPGEEVMMQHSFVVMDILYREV